MPKDAYEQFLAALTAKRRPALELAQRLLQQDRFDEAEQAVRAVDDSIYGGVALAKLYRESLARLVEQRDPPCAPARLEAYFERAEHWAHWAYPEPHTAVEAEDYEQGRAEDTRTLIAILGYHPKPS